MKKNDDDALRAAYALNMCTVSVSQIIDYSDVNVLEQEYEAILNNLNLEQIPKDEALLHILKELLNVITYFRIEAGEKAMVEKEYQQKMKNAIWASVPDFGMIVAGGNPLTMAVSLASQVGIGYMNYRRNKAEYGFEKEKRNWELQKTAIEQFNGLRRELFDTAWRLADAFGFPDEYRLTEKQIAHYNKILMDQDEVRKYERLESVKGDFEAYPPFWYFIGSSANYIAGNPDFKRETSAQYREKALGYFEKYESLYENYSILRQDQIAASCALEHIDLILAGEKPDMIRVKKLLDIAVNNAKESNDILELCALTYLKIGKQTEAGEILRTLVNEDYNTIVNAQLLSGIYVNQRNKSDYELLEARVGTEYLYPMPEGNEKPELLQKEFLDQQRSVLKRKYKIVLHEYLEKYSREWNRITSTFESEVEYPDSFYSDTAQAKDERMEQARRIFSDANKKEYYNRRMKAMGYELQMLSVLNDMYSRLIDSESFSSNYILGQVKAAIEEKIKGSKDKINNLQDAISNSCFDFNCYIDSQDITMRSIADEALKLVYNYVVKQVDSADSVEMAHMESSLRLFCADNDLDEPEVATNRVAEHLFDKKKDPFGPQLFGLKAVAEKKYTEFVSEMASFIKGRFGIDNILNDQTAIYFSDMPEFDAYFRCDAFARHADVKSHSLMVLKDMTKRKFDLIFTTDGIVAVINNKTKTLTPYKEITLKDDSIFLYRDELRKYKYKPLSFDTRTLYSLIEQLATNFVKDISKKIEFIGGVVTPKVLNAWFKEQEGAMDKSATRMYAFPRKDVLEKLGYHFEESLDSDKYLLQLYCITESGQLLGLRVIRFDKIDSNFQAYLMEKGGMIKVK